MRIYLQPIISTLKIAAILILLFVGVGRVPFRAQGKSDFRLLSVKVVGSRRFNPEESVQASGLKLGEQISLQSLSEAANQLAAYGVFSSVNYRYQTQGDSVSVIFTVEDAKKFLPCTFGNFIWYSPQELKDAIHSRVPFFDGKVPLGGSMAGLVSAALSALLETRGIHARVEYNPQQQSLGGEIVSLEFDAKGVPMPVRKIEFTGVQTMAPSNLQKAASPLLNKDYELSFVHDFSNGGIADVYREKGYLRVQFGDPIPHLLSGDPEANAVSVTIPVTEGEVYRLRHLTWSGTTVIPYTEVAKTFHDKVGNPVDALQIEQETLAIAMLYHPKGYLNADATAKSTFDDASHTASYEIQIRQGDLFRMGKLALTGLDDGRTRSLERLFRLHSGDVFTTAEVDSSLRDMTQRLPSGWAMGDAQIQERNDTKTVNVIIPLHPGGNR